MLLLLLVLALNAPGAVHAGRYAQCPHDGSDGLTVELYTLYAAGNASAIAGVTCIPTNEFALYTGDFVLAGSASLLSFEDGAFGCGGLCGGGFKGTLRITGAYPSLLRVGVGAFEDAGNADSRIDFSSGLPSLKTIATKSFQSFPGTITIKGEFPSLHSVEANAFAGAGNAGSAVAVGCSSPDGPLVVHAT